ncbi:endonuclease I family protein [Bacillus atrophaeus]|uniref:endonuclease I family protein n=1 Tax=Bacillus atrophaeus TaxID=1452 RepID=UPI002DBB47AA|nr:endonuclease [Bacillus atrophaeus]MEC2307121.1 endonuclease [Bacillus atrophaeus]
MNFKMKNTLILFTIITFLSACNMDRNTERNQSQEDLNRHSLHNNENIAYRNENKDEDSSILENYYKDVKGKTGEDLKNILNIIISNQKTITYDEVWDALKKTDEDPKSKNNVLLFYAGRSQSKNSNGTCNDCWNREHVWAQSHFNHDKQIRTDLHNLKPEDVSINRDRSALDFDIGSENDGTCNGIKHNEAPDTCYKTLGWWEPRDEIKGDVARMLFYMDVRYDKSLDLKLVDAIKTQSPHQGKLSTLIKWHNEDPVDSFERRRNNIIYSEFQHNRNPFIDHPEWVEEIFGNR